MTDRSELEQLQAPLRALEAQSRIKQARVDRLRRELQEATKEQAVVNEHYRKHLIYYARKDCLELVHMMHQKLPVEIRDFVYECLCVEPDQPIPVGPYYHFRQYDQALHVPLGRLSSLRFGPQLTWASPNRRRVNPNSYAAHIGSVTADDVVMGEPSGTDAANDGAVQADEPRGLDGSQLAMDPELAERIKEMNVQSDIEDTNISDDALILPNGQVKQDHSKKPASEIVLPSSHFLNPRYVGPAIAYDIQKVYYSRNTFSICTVEDAIRRFLVFDTSLSMEKWRGGRPPNVARDLNLPLPIRTFEHVRKLQIRVKFEQFHSNMPQRASPDEKGAYERHFLRFVGWNLSGLEVLLDRDSKLGLDIEFIIMTTLRDVTDDEVGWDAQCNWINFLQSVRNTVYLMKYDCPNTTVKVTHHDDGISPFPRNLTGLFALTKEQWKYERSVNNTRGNSSQVDSWVSDFYLAVPLNPGMEPDDLPIGFSGREQDQLMRERWGIDDALDTTPTHPIKEGKYWPKGNRSDTWQDNP